MNGRGREAAALIAVAWAGSLSFLFVSLQPLLVGAWIDTAHFTRADASLALSANLLGSLVGALATLWFVTRTRVRNLVIASALLMGGASGAVAALSPQPLVLWSLLFVDGVGAGFIGAAAAASAGSMPHPNRVFAIIIASQILTGAAAIMATPMVVRAFGLQGLFLGVAAVSVAIAPFAGVFFEPGAGVGAVKRESVMSRSAGLLLVSLSLLFVANNAVWAYVERIADAAGLSHTEVGTALSVGQAMCLAFAIAAGVFDKLDRRSAMAGGIVLMCVSAPLFAVAPSFFGVIIGVAGFLGALCFVVPFYQGAFAAADPSGRLVVWGQSAITIGLMLGPPAAAAVIDRSSTNAMIWSSIGLTIIALALVFPALPRSAVAVGKHQVPDHG